MPLRRSTSPTRVSVAIATLTRVAVCIAAFAASAPASADESPNPPAHLTAYGLDWLNYIDPNDLPLTKYAVCIVDSGTLVTPDTPPDNPDGPIIERLSTDGGPGTPQGTAPEQLHGTQMAMAAIAPVNDWGTIGTTTWGRVISVRAMVNNELGFNSDAYRKGIEACRLTVSESPIAAVSLSLGCDCQIPSQQEQRLDDALASARSRGVSVVAAAGNNPGAPVAEPAANPQVIAVAAGAASGVLCDYATFDDQVELLGPACPIEAADPMSGDPQADFGGGSSAATAITSTLIAALRTLRPDATRAQVESWMLGSAREVNGVRALDGEAAARAAGLGDVVDRARIRMASAIATPVMSASPAATTGVSPVVVAEPSATSSPAAHVVPISSGAVAGGASHHAMPRRLPMPRGVRVSLRKHRLVVSVQSVPAGARLRVLAREPGWRHAHRRLLRVMTSRRTITLSLAWLPDRLCLWFVPRREFERQVSKPRILTRTRSGRFR